MIPVSRAALIVNSSSRLGEQAFRDACAALRALKIDTDAHAVDDPERLPEIARAALDKKPDVLILGGGDGTISGLVDYLVDENIPLGLLPLGTANSFARSLGIPLDLDEAINIIAAGHRRPIDLGMIDNDYFANFAAIGMSPMIAETIPHGLKKWGGRIGYALWAAVQALRFRPFELTIIDDHGKRETLFALEVRIANGSYQGGTELVEDAEVDSGEIIVQVVEGRTHGRLALSWLLSLLRLPHLDGTTREFHGRKLRIETVPPLPISIDGEVLAETPVTVKIAPKVIEVMSPRHSTGSGSGSVLQEPRKSAKG
jgi:YegS/Rv2252/BmrU family lipid kinase